jgi:hypothetical protein
VAQLTLAGPALPAAAPEDPAIAETTVVAALAWERSSGAIDGGCVGCGLSAGLALPTSPGNVWDGGTYASWGQTHAVDVWHFKATFTLPDDLDPATATGVLHDPYYASDIIPINDNLYVFVNGVHQFTGGTNYGASRSGGIPETDGWYVGAAMLSGFKAGENVIDVVTEERASWGGLGYLELRLSGGPALVTIVEPADGTELPLNQATVVRAEADASVTRVEFLADAGSGPQLIGQAQAPFAVTWTPLAAGDYTLTARGFQDDVLIDESAPVAVRVVANDPPTVSVAATDETATEPPFATPTPTLSAAADADAIDTGAFTVTRTGNLTGPLPVFFSAAGTARRGADYAGLGASVTIPAGQATATLTVTPRADALRERDETVEITLLPNASYVVAEPSRASVLIQERGGLQVYIQGYPDEGAYRWYLPRGDVRGNELLPNAEARLRFWIWWDDPAPSDERHDLYVQLVHVSQFRGSSLNTGSREHPDFLLEADRNPNFEVIEPDELPGGKLQALRAFANAMPRGRRNARLLTISSYDFGGNGVIRVLDSQAGVIAEKRFPRDDDEDLLPDAWEGGQRYFNGQAFVAFDTSARRSPGSTTPEEASDASDDSDWDLSTGRPAEERQIEKGDGFSAFEEYRGLFVNGTHRRFDELANDGPGGRRGGTQWKDVFVLDELQAGEATVRMGLRHLREAGLVWHRVRRSDWKGGPDLIAVEGGETRMQPIAANGPGFGNQRGVWLRRGRLDGGIFGATRSTIAGGLPAVVDVGAIRARRFSDEQGAIDTVVTHEILHLMTIGHPPSRVLTFSPAFQDEPSEDAYFFKTTDGAPDRSKVLFWTPFRRMQDLVFPFESPDPGSASPLNQMVRRVDALDIRKSGAFTRHGQPHSGIVLQLTLDQDLADTSAPLELYSHTGFLNEALYSGHASRLGADERRNVQVKK